jgi:TonB-linked SusC/RagA family outer membrane protein
MRKLLLFFTIMTVTASMAWAQNTVSGKVISEAEDGMALPGVSILIVGTTTGTVTDADGNYKISVPSGDVTLRYSYIGYINQDIVVGNQTVIDVTLLEDATQLEEVVVTSLGIARSTKALNYSVTEVDGDNFTEAREKNLANQLTGRIAGVNVSNIASGPAGSTRVIIRGNKSLEGNNQPLYVIDGMPIDNSNFGNAGIWGGRDEGDGMTSISPDDIASIEVLKGANAAALYGARAANGVINITTKTGSSRKGIGVEFNSNFVFETLYDMRELQREYGQGNYVLSDPADPDSDRIPVAPRDQQEGTSWNTTSWGPRLGSGTFVAFDGIQRPYEDQGDQFPSWFENGWTFTNTLALTGGNANQNFRFAFSDLRNEGIVPNSGMNRQNFTLSMNSKFGKRFSANAKLMYSHEEIKNRPRLSDSPMNGILAMYYLPANSDIDWYRGDPDKLGAVPLDADDASLQIWQKAPGEELPAGQHNWHQNPWWVAYQNEQMDTRDRLIGSAQLQYDITDWLWLRGRAGLDWYTRLREEITPQGTSYQRGGSMSENERRVRETNLEWMLGMNDTYGPISVTAFVGGNWMRRHYEELNLSGNGFNVPFEEFINNTVTRNWGYGISETGINSIFGSAEIGYKGFLYLTATARNDWFSVLNPENNSILYPSIGASWVFSDNINNLPNWFSFGKVRASWAQVGNVTVGAYSTNLTYSLKNSHLAYTLASYSSAGGSGGTIPNPGLKPLTSTELEIGADLRFFQDRLGLDFTWYDQESTDDILRATISNASGFGNTTVNVGRISNTGVEILLYGTPVKKALTWDISLNFARNNNLVEELIEGNDELSLEEPRTRTVRVKHIVGYPYGMLTGWVQKTTPDGTPVYESNGAPVRSDAYEIIGYGVPDFTGGLENSFTWKNINLSFLIDFKSGGNIFSGTNVRLTQTGLTEITLEGRDPSDPKSVSGAIQTGEDANGDPIYAPFDYTMTPDESRNYWNQLANRATDEFTYDASYVKLRQLTLGYSFPRSVLANTPFVNLTLSFVGRNLWIISKNTPNIDPESSYTSSNSQGLDYFGQPSVRSWGFNLRMGF